MRRRLSAELAVVAVVEALEIDLIQIHPRAQVFEHLRRSVSVRHEPGEQPCGLGAAEDGHGPLGRDQRLVVRTDDHAGAGAPGQFHDLPGSSRPGRRHRIWIAQCLRGDPILAVSTVEIAAEHAEAQRGRAWRHVKERLFLNGIALHALYVSPGNPQLASAIEADLADPGLPVENRAAVAAGEAADAAVVDRLPQLAFADCAREAV